MSLIKQNMVRNHQLVNSGTEQAAVRKKSAKQARSYLRCRKREGDPALPVELPAQVAVHRVERGLLLFVVQGDVVQRAALRPIGRGGTDGVIAERDQVNGWTGVRGRRSGAG